MIEDQARARLEGWKQSLLDLSTGDGLLDAREGRACIALPGVDPLRLAAALASGSTFAFDGGRSGAGDAAACFDTGKLRLALAPAELAQRLTAMRRAARAQLADGGEHALWLGLGRLHWCEADGVTHAAPLWLVPVELVASAGTLRLAPVASVDATCNITLAEKLRRDFDVVLDERDFDVVLEAAEGVAVTRPGWRVERSAVLGVFSFARVALWRELDARGDALCAHPLVAQLAAGGAQAFAQPTAAAAAAVTLQLGGDRRSAAIHATELLAPLDADTGQLVAVAAAGAGASFVLQGPPGTGKSQTIANLIVHAVSHGKSVLFVSDKTSALEVVQQRLAAVGLGEFCLALHGHTAARAQVLQQLARVLERAFRPGSGPGGDDARLAELRAALDGHAAALHRVGPFGRSLHEVLGRLVELRTSPRAALAERDATGLDAATFARRRDAIRELARTALAVEPVAGHPWQLSTLAAWPADGRARALAALDEAAAAGAALADAARDLAALVPGIVARTRAQLQALGALAAVAAASPRPGAELLTQLRAARGDEIGEQIALIRARGGGTIEAPRDPLSFLLLANRHRALAAEVAAQLTDRIADLDAPSLWSQLRKWTGRVAPVRYMALRTARADVRAAAVPGELATDDAMIAALEAVIAERACRHALLAAAAPAKRWFGDLHGEDLLALDLPKLDAAVAWAAELRKAFDAVELAGGDAARTAAWRALVAQVAAGPGSDPTTATPFARLAACVARWLPALAALAETTGIDPARLGAGDDHITALRDQVETLRHTLDALGDWVAFHAARGAALAAGVGPAVAAIERGDLGAAELGDAWERATLLAWADAELAETPALARFHGAAHHAHVAAFADLDRATLALVRARALVRLAERVPRAIPANKDAAGADAAGELGTLLQELKQPRPVSLRALFAELPTLLPRLAPCVLASPLAAAQHLDARLRFDVVVFDEASRLPTAVALGALARATSAVIVGDAQQLRPTDGTASLLDDALAARLPELRLAWHYRSKHEDLIAFANQRYYGDRLQVFPAAQASPDLGISWRSSGGVIADDANRAEADAVVADVLARLRDPGQRTRSIAVVTLTRAQQALIEDLLDAARAADPTLDAFFADAARAPAEPVLVADVDAAQGEERDVVLLSLACTADAAPRAGADAARALAVATTRAREQLVVFSRFVPEDVAVDVGADPALRDLADLLAFARAGGGAAKPADDAPAASPITAAIARALGERGWTVKHQVGCGAYKLDLAIVDPNEPERYVLAIEHDGAAYASAPSARDRDRLRPQVLAQLGWRLHRIWSLDWWADAEREIQRAHGAIVAAVAASRQRRAPAPAPRTARTTRPGVAAGSAPVVRIPPRDTTAVTPRSIAFEPTTGATAAASAQADTRPHLAAGSAPIRIARGTIPIGPYTVAAIPAGRRAPDDLFAPRYLPEVGKIVEQVLAAEAPMHVDLLARRVGGYFGIGRLSPRVTDQVRIALAGRAKWGDEANFVWRVDQDPAGVPPVRVAGHGPAALRDIEQVPLSELAAAARIVVERAAGIGPNELVRDAARLLGFSRITDRVLDRVALGVQLAAQRTLIVVDNNRAKLPD